MSPGYTDILKKNYLSTRLAFWILLASFIASLGLTAFQSWLEYRDNLNKVNLNQEFIKKNYLPILSDYIYKLDSSGLELAVQSILRMEYIEGINIRETVNQKLKISTYGRKFLSAYTKYQYPLVSKNKYGEKNELGQIELAVNIKKIQEKFIGSMIDILIPNLISSLILALLALLINYQLIGKYLHRVSRFVEEVEFESAGFHNKKIQLSRKKNRQDELFTIEAGINNMLVRLRSGMKEIQRTQQELYKTKSYLGNIINSMPSLIIGLDKKIHITSLNNLAKQYLGLDQEQSNSKEYLFDLLPNMKKYLQDIESVFSTRKKKEIKRVALKFDDFEKVFNVNIFPLVTNGIDGAVLRLDDITEQIQIEEILVQTEKMMTLGGLAAGMAHEINNPLGIISQSIQNTLRRISPKLVKNCEMADKIGLPLTKIREYFEKRNITKYLESISEAVQRASKIVSNMLNFSRQNEISEKKKLNIHGVLDRAISFAENDYDLNKKSVLSGTKLALVWSKKVSHYP